jgi:flavin reductase (DIM6/NTAB) family NADH-FMN oxidoreductase RutF
MTKRKIASQAFPYPMPMSVVSALVDGKVNHLAVGWLTRVNRQPPLIAVALGKSHYTNRGIHEHRAFGVSIPPVAQIAAVDYVGLVSGAKQDKSDVFEVFYGELAAAPLIAPFPVNIACRLERVIELPTNELFIGEIVEAFCDEDCLTDGKPDLEKLDAYTLTMPDNRYWRTGPCAGKAWSVGKGYR